MKILLAPVGTEGDIRPMVALGLALREAGHGVSACVPPDLTSHFTGHGIPAAGVGIDVHSFFRDNARELLRRPTSTIGPMLRVFPEVVRQQFEGLVPLAREADVIVSAGLQFAGKSVAESLGKPHWHAHHVPWLFESSHHPPMSVPLTNLPRFANWLIWKMSILGFTVMLRPVMNRHRRSLGLKPIGNIQTFLSDGMLCAADEVLAKVAPDVKVRYVQTAYWPLRDDREIDAETRRFIDAGEPPVYLGFGSMGESSPERMMRIIEVAVGEAGVRALVGSGWAQLRSSGDRVHVVGHVSHAALFPRMAAVVHHGGAGTTYTAARAGVPQVVVPHILDQFFWGERVRRLGIGPRAIPRIRLTADALARALQTAVTDVSMKKRAQEISIAIAARDGIAEGVRVVTSS